MRGLTLWQPWASLVALGPLAKPHETRSYRTRYRGPLVIHAAKTKHKRLQTATLEANGALSPIGLGLPNPLPFGVIVAVAELTGCRPMGGPAGAVPAHDLDRAFGDWSPGRFAWRLENVVALAEPIEAKGYQSLWIPDAAVADAVQDLVGVKAVAKGQGELFDVAAPPKTRRVMMHVCDAGEGGDWGVEGSGPLAVRMECKRCGHETDWFTVQNMTEGRRGLPCPKCNKEQA